LHEHFRIGHYTDIVGGTGCTVILSSEGFNASAYARGSASGTREFALLSPHRKIEKIHALLFTGGSALGFWSYVIFKGKRYGV